MAKVLGFATEAVHDNGSDACEKVTSTCCTDDSLNKWKKEWNDKSEQINAYVWSLGKIPTMFVSLLENIDEKKAGCKAVPKKARTDRVLEKKSDKSSLVSDISQQYLNHRKLDVTNGNSFQPSWLDDYSWEFFGVQNDVRMNPKSLVPILEVIKLHFTGTKYNPPGANSAPYESVEGAAAIVDLITFLNDDSNKADPLVLKKGLSMAADDNARVQSAAGSDNTEGTDTRILKYGKAQANASEVVYNGWKTGTEALLHLLIDDGDTERKQRKKVMSKAYAQVGLGHVDSTSNTGSIVDVIYANDYHEKDPNNIVQPDAGKEPCLFDRLGQNTDCRTPFRKFLDSFNFGADYATAWEKAVLTCYDEKAAMKSHLYCAACDSAVDSKVKKTEGTVLDKYEVQVKARGMNDLIEACVPMYYYWQRNLGPQLRALNEWVGAASGKEDDQSELLKSLEKLFNINVNNCVDTPLTARRLGDPDVDVNGLIERKSMVNQSSTPPMKVQVTATCVSDVEDLMTGYALSENPLTSELQKDIWKLLRKAVKYLETAKGEEIFKAYGGKYPYPFDADRLLRLLRLPSKSRALFGTDVYDVNIVRNDLTGVDLKSYNPTGVSALFAKPRDDQKVAEYIDDKVSNLCNSDVTNPDDPNHPDNKSGKLIAFATTLVGTLYVLFN